MASAWTDGGEPGGLTLRWRAMGEGSALVLLHKLGGWIAEWEALGKALPGRRVIAIDLPGHGGAGGPAPYVQDAEDSAARVLATLDAMGVGDFALGGASLGGSVAVVVAAKAPARVRALVLISVALTGPSTLAAMQQADRKGDGVLFDADDLPRDRSFEDISGLFGLTDPGLVQDMNDSRRAAGAWVRASFRGASLADIRGRLPRITAPTLLIYGERGGAGYAASEQTGLTMTPDARVTHLPAASAFPHQDQPALTAQAVEEFLKSHALS